VSPENLKSLPEKPNPFEFSERELLFDRVSHQRFMPILEHEQTNILRAEISSNAFGEFLFVTTSRGVAEKREYVTFWGLGFHNYRERWITEEWHLNRADSYPENLLQSLTLDEIRAVIQERQTEIAPYAQGDTQSKRGELFEMLADLTDEDGAWAEIDDLEGLFGDDDEW
jgi:hypothetical protein